MSKNSSEQIKWRYNGYNDTIEFPNPLGHEVYRHKVRGHNA